MSRKRVLISEVPIFAGLNVKGDSHLPTHLETPSLGYVYSLRGPRKRLPPFILLHSFLSERRKSPGQAAGFPYGFLFENMIY